MFKPFVFNVYGCGFDSHERHVNVTPAQFSREVNALPTVVGFLRVLRFPPTGKFDRVVSVKQAHSNWHMFANCRDLAFVPK